MRKARCECELGWDRSVACVQAPTSACMRDGGGYMLMDSITTTPLFADDDGKRYEHARITANKELDLNNSIVVR